MVPLGFTGFTSILRLRTKEKAVNVMWPAPEEPRRGPGRTRR
jgi:hypothetical protein